MKAAQQIVESFTSSSDEEELDEKAILDVLYKHYNPPSGIQLARLSSYLENVLHSGAATCLICIASIKRNDAIWNCKNCFVFFHLNCIRRWANDSLLHLKKQVEQSLHDQGHYNHLGQYVAPKKQSSLYWCCPQCRKEYPSDDKPSQYECFCGKEINPATQPFLVPHSCGEICGKFLSSNCGHDCKLLCHPGPCPPCAQSTFISCLCGKSSPKFIRCVDKYWQCENLCKQKKHCGEHICNEKCHRPGQCGFCKSTKMQSCECGNEVKERNCSDLKWNCKKVCGVKYSCQIHVCKRICHTGLCGPCPLGLPRTCPCGKMTKVGPCTEIIENCGDTCQKVLPCGIHTCEQRCHRGYCNLCLVIVKKKCRCGLHVKDLPCSKEFTCDTKCKLLRDCGKHPCNRKCCDGQCPPCEKICGKQLLCNKHKCTSVCHNGPCYPCNIKSQISCQCGKTRKSVPCGRERRVRINCLEVCRIASKCHHQNTHRCHKGDCAPCTKICGLKNDVSGCDHLCTARCHTAIRVEYTTTATSTAITSKKYQYKKFPHPRCEQKVEVTCIGGHEIMEKPCWDSKPSSCQNKCNRKLLCGRHNCDLICHSVPDIQNMEQQPGCKSCEEGCKISRPEGCKHLCPRPCHLEQCSPCNVNIRRKCHCGLNQVIYKCNEFFSNLGTEQEIRERQEKFKSCGNRCMKNLPCGHRCTSNCHSGDCSNSESCRKKIKIYCECKRLKYYVTCNKFQAGQTSLICDTNCVEALKTLLESQMKESEKLKRLEDEKNNLELERFEKKFSKRKFKERKVHTNRNKRTIDWKFISIYVIFFVALVIAFFVAFYSDN